MKRGRWQGMLTIVEFNWPFYLAAIGVFAVAISGLFLGSLMMKLIAAAAAAGAGYFLIGSLGVSHLIYDRSDLYRWRWVDRARRGATFHRAIFCHSGFDESSVELRERLPSLAWLVLDHFDAGRMTEASGTLRTSLRTAKPSTCGRTARDAPSGRRDAHPTRGTSPRRDDGGAECGFSSRRLAVGARRATGVSSPQK